MLSPAYIQGISCISAQPTYRPGYFLENTVESENGPIRADEPDYKTYIPAAQLRRLNKSMKMSVYAAHGALADAGIDHIQAIITGTGLGCLADTERFVEMMNEQQEAQLNPTPFILSTHNMAAAAIALSLNCQGYNMTYSHGASSFESALVDALLYLTEHPKDQLLLGGMDELGEKITLFDQRITPPGIYKSAEGAALFVLAGTPGKNTYGQIHAAETQHGKENPKDFIEDFIARNKLHMHDIQAVIVGDKQDRHLFPGISQIGYRHIFGQFDTASSIALWLAALILRKQQVPPALLLNGMPVNPINHLLIYHRPAIENHSLILVKR